MRRPTLVALLLLLLLAVACSEEAPPPAEVDSVKISVADNGLYRVTADDLRGAGFPVTALQEGAVRLSEAGSEVPFILEGETLVFYGRASTSRYTPVRTYILEAGQGGTQMKTGAAGGEHGDRTDVIRRTVHLERNVEYVGDAAVDGDTAPWFWQTVGLQESDPVQFDLHAVADGAGTVRVGLVGITEHTSDPDHSLGLVVNGNELAQLSWDGQSAYTATTPLPAGTLHNGQNQIQFSAQPKEHLDISKLDWIEIEYGSHPHAANDLLDFSAGPGAIRLEGFSERPLIVDVSDAASPVQLTDWTFDGDQVHLTLEQEAVVVAAASGGFLRPEAIEPLRRGKWDAEQHQADLLIVTTAELAPAMEPLVNARRDAGLTVALVPVEELYDTFGYGAETPNSINRFLKYTHEKWQSPAPRYLLIVGDATTDYWGHLATGGEDPISPPRNVIPPYLVPVSFGGETVSDARLADIDGDYLPELSVGRWPVTTVAEVEDLVSRTLAYERRSAPQRALFVADGSSNEFERVTDSIMTAGDFTDEHSEFVRGPAPADLASTWQEGAWLVTYTGHGSLQLWGQEGMLSSENVDFVENSEVSPIVLQLTCLTGLFAHPEVTSLSEVMLTSENGPALIVGATSLTLSLHQEPFAAALLQALRDPSVERIGDALQLAREPLDMDVIGLREISDTFVLLGDPSARIMRPQSPDA
ncbi:MAG: C25 family cysteine peptidase [Chloroflexota bacterium]